MLELRPATLDDAPAAAELFRSRDLADFGESDRTPAQVRGLWSEEPYASRWLAWLDDRCAGYGRLLDGGAEFAEIHDESCTHPELEGRGVASALFGRLEPLAAEKGFAIIRATAVNDAGRALLAGRDYELTEYVWRMEADLDEATRPKPPPPGYRLADYREGEDDEALFDCETRSGASWAYDAATFELWAHHRHSRADYDPSAWSVAWVGDAVAGAALGFPLEGRAWILDVFVAPEHRGRGLGLALVQDCFRRLREAGCSRVGLEVEAGNETGAVQLYERAGMHATRRYDVYEKAL